MKTIGLIGGMSWESSAEYYRIINQSVNKRIGGLHSAQSVMYSFDFEEIEVLQKAGQWAEATERMTAAARSLEKAGAACVVICTNTMHKMADAVEAAVEIPLLHIADATAAAIRQARLSRVGLLGTRFTMEEPFYKDRLVKRYGLEVLVPEASSRQTVHDIIYDELCLGIIREPSRASYVQIIRRLVDQGAQGVILGCTEIGLLISQSDSPVPVFDTTQIHAEAAVTFALT